MAHTITPDLKNNVSEPVLKNFQEIDSKIGSGPKNSVLTEEKTMIWGIIFGDVGGHKHVILDQYRLWTVKYESFHKE